MSANRIAQDAPENTATGITTIHAIAIQQRGMMSILKLEACSDCGLRAFDLAKHKCVLDPPPTRRAGTRRDNGFKWVRGKRKSYG